MAYTRRRSGAPGCIQGMAKSFTDSSRTTRPFRASTPTRARWLDCWPGKTGRGFAGDRDGRGCAPDNQWKKSDLNRCWIVRRPSLNQTIDQFQPLASSLVEFANNSFLPYELHLLFTDFLFQ